jgi:outer membrane protein
MLKRLTTFIILLTAFVAAQAQQKIGLQQAVDLALQNNLQIKQAQLSEALSEEDLKQSKLSLFPTLNADNSGSYNVGRTFDQQAGQLIDKSTKGLNERLTSSVTVFQGFQKRNQILQNKLDLEGDKSYTRKIKNDLSLSVVTTYLQVINGRDLVEASKQQLEFANQQLDREQKLFDVGNNTLADLSQAKANVSTAELNLTNSQNQLDLAFLDLAQLMELPAGTTFDVEVPVINSVGQINNQAKAQEVYNTAMVNYPDIKVAEYRRLAAEKTLLISRGALMPRLSFNGSLGTGYSSNGVRLIAVPGTTDYIRVPATFGEQLGDSYAKSIGFTLSIPIFNGYQARSAVNRAKISLNNYQIQEDLAKNTLNKTINQAVYDLRAAEKRYISTQSAYNSSNDAFNVIKQRYEVGLVNSLDYNQSQINLNKAQFDMIQAKYDLLFRNKLIDFYLGKPLTF